ncbi:CDP-alcohol phosphatidyltransferase family protein [Methylobacterium planeticum]|uniref:CDP-diacylglycerol--glycerol-3-phosphate 3-phosphatidyltransferase n=1 Tax=Methylobacterium planeticum TaxID=2615211 RepID=A0A6N6MNI4_9HYPH|nr:CDP-alcohol phosphatidyltransferase family protein [Methylobacterium planeticum]KAB1071977.1 CDP-alcohol phosphatidyltransferase family protein [Methylobacterium planeticum]
MTIPNLITIGRIVLVPVIVALIGQGAWALAFAGFVVAGLSDALDGFIAKRFAMRSELGAVLDPLADKALLVSVYVALAVQGAIPGWLAIAVVARDLMVIAAILVAWLMSRPLAIRPLALGKLNTGVQIAFAALALGSRAAELSLGGLETAASAGVAALTALTAALYLRLWLQHMGSGPARP